MEQIHAETQSCEGGVEAKESAFHLAPALWGAALLCCASMAALGAAIYWQVLPIPAHWAALLACGIGSVASIFSALWCQGHLSRSLQRKHEYEGVEQRLNSLSAQVQATDAWLRQRQATLINLHTQLARQSASAIEQLRAVNKRQAMQQDRTQQFLEDMPPLLDGLQTQREALAGLDFKRFEHVFDTMEHAAALQSDLASALEEVTQNAASAGASLTHTASQVKADSATFGRAAVHSVAGIVAATGPVEDAAIAVARASDTLEASVSGFEGERKGLMDGLSDGIASLGGFAEDAQSALRAAAVPVEAAANTAARASAALEASAKGFEEQHKGLLVGLEEEIAALGGIAGDAHSILGAAAAEIGPAAKTILEDRTAGLARASETHARTIDAAAQAVTSFQGGIDSAHAALADTAALATDLRSHKDDALKALEAQVLAASKTHDALEKAAKPARQKLGALAALETSSFAGLVEHVSGLARELDAMREKETLLLNDLGVRLAGLEAGLADDVSSAASKAMRAPLRALKDQIAQHNGAVLADLKQMRTAHIQPIKRSIRALPEALAAAVLPPLHASTQALQTQLREISERPDPNMEAVPQLAEITAPPLDLAAASVAERLAHALSDMQAIEEDVAGLATAALSAPEDAAASDAFKHVLGESEQALRSWGGSLDNVTTAIAIARDAS